MKPLGGRVAVVTGGARGIGKGIAQALTAQGVRVAIGDLDGEVARKTAAAIGGGAIGGDLDVTDRPAFTEFLDRTERDLGPLEIMVNNAGILPLGRFVNEDDELTERQIEIMLLGAPHGSKQAARRMVPRRTDHIFNVASVAGYLPGAGAVSYVASKFGVVGMSESLALELRGTGVDITVIAPALVHTDMTAGMAPFKGIRPVTPHDVGKAVVRALHSRRFAAFVPAEAGVAARAYCSLPYRVRFAIVRMTGADTSPLEVDRVARAGYDSEIERTRRKSEVTI